MTEMLLLTRKLRLSHTIQMPLHRVRAKNIALAKDEAVLLDADSDEACITTAAEEVAVGD